MTSRDTIYLLALALPASSVREAILLECVQAERLAGLRERQTVRELAAEACARECRKPCRVP